MSSSTEIRQVYQYFIIVVSYFFMIFCDNIISRQNNGRMKGEITYVTKRRKYLQEKRWALGRSLLQDKR